MHWIEFFMQIDASYNLISTDVIHNITKENVKNG